MATHGWFPDLGEKGLCAPQRQIVQKGGKNSLGNSGSAASQLLLFMGSVFSFVCWLGRTK